ncbi:MAG: hypothetical protein ACRDNO_29775 [Trebonia sp.]
MPIAEALLAGPRGRRLSWTLLWAGLAGAAERPASWNRVFRAVHSGDLSGCLDDFSSCLARADPAALAADPAAVLWALGWTVARAQYWQEPDAEDQAFAPAAARAALRPVAAALARAPGSGWWTSPMDPERQRYAQFLGDDHQFDEPRLSGAADRVAAWRADTARKEESLPADSAEPLGAWSGEWWSDPAMSGLPITTRALAGLGSRPGLGALRLALVEDRLGWESARCWPLRPRSGARVYEVDGPAAWAALVARYPLDVSRSRRHDWWRATGRAGRWLIPDYQAVAEDYDAVHVTVLGYLTTAGVAVPVSSDDSYGGARTLLAGWEPDATWWLTDCLAPDGPPEAWAADDDPAAGWHPVA